MADEARRATWRSAERVRAGGLAIVAPLFGRLLFRLCLGRWPDADEHRVFRSGLVDRAVPLPPALRAMLPMPEATELVNHFLLLRMVRTGRLQTTNAFDQHHAAGEAPGVPPLSGNPVAFWRGQPVAFLHLEKTGGGAIAQALTEACHPEQIDPDPRRTAAPHALAPFTGRDPAAIRRRALIYGHYDLPSLRRLDTERPVITVLRAPERRILSLYYYWRSINRDVLDTTADNEAVKLAQDCDLLAFLETRDPSVRNYIDNFYVRRLTGTYVSADGHDRLAACPLSHLDRALAALRAVEFVGVTEQMGLTLASLRRRFDLDGGPGPERHNVGLDNGRVAPRVFHDVTRVPPTPDQERALVRLTSLDAVLYAAACERFDGDHVAAGGDGLPHGPQRI